MALPAPTRSALGAFIQSPLRVRDRGEIIPPEPDEGAGIYTVSDGGRGYRVSRTGAWETLGANPDAGGLGYVLWTRGRLWLGGRHYDGLDGVWPPASLFNPSIIFEHDGYLLGATGIEAGGSSVLAWNEAIQEWDATLGPYAGDVDPATFDPVISGFSVSAGGDLWVLTKQWNTSSSTSARSFIYQNDGVTGWQPYFFPFSVVTWSNFLRGYSRNIVSVGGNYLMSGFIDDNTEKTGFPLNEDPVTFARWDGEPLVNEPDAELIDASQTSGEFAYFIDEDAVGAPSYQRRLSVSVGQGSDIYSGSITGLSETPGDNTFRVTIGGVFVEVVGDAPESVTAAALAAACQGSVDTGFLEITWTSSGVEVIGVPGAGVTFTAVLSAEGVGTGSVSQFAPSGQLFEAAAWGGGYETTAESQFQSGLMRVTSSAISRMATVEQASSTPANDRVTQSQTLPDGRIAFTGRFLGVITGGNDIVASNLAAYDQTTDTVEPLSRVLYVATIDSLDPAPADNLFRITIGTDFVEVPGQSNPNATTFFLTSAAVQSTAPAFQAYEWSSSENRIGAIIPLGAANAAVLSVSGSGTGTVTDFQVTAGYPTANIMTGLDVVPANGLREPTLSFPDLNAIGDSFALAGGAYSFQPASDTGSFWMFAGNQATQTNAGLNINAASGAITSAGIVKGTYTVNVYVANALTWKVDEYTLFSQDTAPVITSVPNTDAPIGNDYTEQMALDSGDTPVVWSIVTAPAGSTIDPASGLLTVPEQAVGSYPINIQAENGAGTGSESWSLSFVGAAVPVIEQVADSTYPVNEVYFQALALTSGDTPITWSLDAPIPPGMNITGYDFGGGPGELAEIDWQVTQAGVWLVKVRASNSGGDGTMQYTLTVS